MSDRTMRKYVTLTAREICMQNNFFEEIRRRQAITRQSDFDLATQADVSPSYYSMLQNGKRRLSLQHARWIGRAVGLEVELLLVPIDETEA